MKLLFSTNLLLLLSAPTAMAAKSTNAELMASWTSAGIDYIWDETHIREEYLASNAFIPNNNNMAGIKIKPPTSDNDEETILYLSVPRWFPGVPSTLNQIKLSKTNLTAPVNLPLEPFPSWEANAVGGDCSGMQYVQSMEIDNDGNMWIIDTGRIDIFSGAPINDCPPKLLIISTETGEMVDEPFIFPTEVASHTSTHLNDLVIDNENQIAYITDSSDAGLIVYDRTNRISKRFTSPTMYPDGMGGSPDASVAWNINGVALASDWPGAGVPMDGIALTPDNSRVYYCTLGGRGLYSLDATKVRTFAMEDAAIEETIVQHGTGKVDATDGMAFTCDGELVYGALNKASVYQWMATHDNSTDPFTTSEILAQDPELMHWVDTFGFDDSDGSLWYVVNYLHELFTTGVAGPAYVFRTPTAGSYQKGPCASTPQTEETGEMEEGGMQDTSSSASISLFGATVVAMVASFLSN